MSGGFSEVGPAGLAAERALVARGVGGEPARGQLPRPRQLRTRDATARRRWPGRLLTVRRDRPGGVLDALLVWLMLVPILLRLTGRAA
jgi:hypothetical protein